MSEKKIELHISLLLELVPVIWQFANRIRIFQFVNNKVFSIQLYKHRFYIFQKYKAEVN